MLFKGTFISSGYGIGVVVRTGNDTENEDKISLVIKSSSAYTTRQIPIIIIPITLETLSKEASNGVFSLIV